MKIISLFNNKGGVGKTTLSYHLSCALALLDKKVLMIDLDPQCNFTLCSVQEENLHKIWEEEDRFIDDFDAARKKEGSQDFDKILSKPRTIHFLLKPTEEGTGDIEKYPPPINVRENLDIIPGRLTLHQYEYKISERWSSAYQGDPLSVRTITKIRSIAINYAKKNNYEYIIFDTSPSLGALNKIIISTVDGFLIPCLPDMFSLYGIRNIGKALEQWRRELDTMYKLISNEKRNNFPCSFVQFLGYTIYNARKYDGNGEWNLAQAHYNYALQIPKAIEEFIPCDARRHLSEAMMKEPIGGMAVMHSHSTLTGMSQKYKAPIWAVPGLTNLEKTDELTIRGNRNRYEITKDAYLKFARDLLTRLITIGK
jgi:cellulose biosynthesis protein BcsQ